MKKRNRIRQRGRKKDTALMYRQTRMKKSVNGFNRRSIRLGGFRQLGGMANAATGMLAALAAKARA